MELESELELKLALERERFDAVCVAERENESL